MTANGKEKEMEQKYSGFKPENTWKPPVLLAYNHVDFHRRFIATRTPAIVQLPINITLAGLDACTEQLVTVEESRLNGFGHGIKREMLFGAFMQSLTKGKTNLYLNTQKNHSDPLLRFLAPPLNVYPSLDPIWKLFPTCIPHEMNLWLGNSTAATSSGLHHDFHDNFYFLVEGKKSFSIASPADAEFMYLENIEKVHENGMIEYTDPDGRIIRQDGAYLDDVGTFRIEHIERLLETATDPKIIEKLEGELDTALEMMMPKEGVWDEEDEDETVQSSFNRTDLETNIEHLGENGDKLPESFSLARSFDNSEEFNMLKSATRIDFTLEPNQMLYLPCGWFHEVKSLGNENSSIHMAINLWTVPHMIVPANDFEHEVGYWQETSWKEVKKRLAD